ncbi:hypothetical protein NQ314_005606 [Rhamnusium bicolor]|uniref:AAA+ ATPase domain-containing protein n=1 Tax=Rhamnusium bicolor TaxID=1586634 RepID=A0AAV8ZI86_9CUCU|nr:hypothetical protein NQ314_005606 [Rhamnusium bicolor]
MWRMLYKLAKVLNDNPGAKRIAEMVRAKVEKFRQFMAVLQTVCNKGLQRRHWDKISEIVGVPLVITPDSTLSDMIEAGLPKFSAQLEEISGAATKEYALQKNLAKMKEEWLEIKFECVPYRDTGVNILTAVDDIQVLMDDHILKAQTMRGSPFVKAFEAEMQAWEDKLITMQDILEQWLNCQATWMYLEPIFSSEDIMRQMPTEARNFKTVDRVWRAIQNYAIKDTRVLVATEYKNMLPLLRENNRLLDEIQKGLNDYLEKKRLFFPRFFFLSNDELLEILSETKDPMRVQPHLKKCFEGIHQLDFNLDEEVVGMISAEKEKVPFSGKIVPAEAKGMVERWLVQVETIMIQSLKDITRDSVNNYPSVDRPTWILNWPGQIVQCVDCVQWTTEVTQAIFNGSLKQQEDLCTEQIESSVKMVQGKLKLNNQVTVEALIVIDVHARDIVKMLKELKVQSIADFNWISQMRYYWRDFLITVSMITTDVMYGFEYLGNTGRLVSTPLTDRCFRTLMGALRLNLGGAPEGPAGTGKTETCKDLAKAVAKKCVVFNCSDGLDYKALGKFFKGLAQAGAWACFDEFNRIELEVLSVVAQQILSIQMAVAAKLKKFVFEGTEITLDPTCTCFITMNPGYAGRQELPDNLKVLFRTVAMMVPDYAMIGEISLYSYGFVQAHSLAQKIVHTYKLCSEQLSSQNHYDYGMRAVKSVLLAAGALRKAYPESEEAQLVLRAIIDSLGDALGRLGGKLGAKLVEHQVIYRIINPKAISMGQLYGQFDPASHEWSDGVLATTFREFANSITVDRKWILFDGPVDAMSNQMNLIFEPADLEQASPATVSRCGMIYMEPALLGWYPFMKSYMATLEKFLLPEQLEILVECIEWLASELIIQTNQSCCQRFFLKTCLNNNMPILFVGPTGTGKTAVVLDHLLNLPKEKYLPNVINFSARTTSVMTQEMVMTKLDKRRRGVFGPSMGKKCVLFVDDVGMPQKEAWGAQPPVELLRQWIDHGHWFDKDTSMLQLVDIMFVGAMGVPGGGRNEVTDRFLRHMQIICLDSFDDNTLNKIFVTILDWHFSKGYVEGIARLSKFVVGATLEVYKEATLSFLPTPTKSHYTFSLRDFARVISGLLLTPPSRMDDPDKFTRLWIHETYRSCYSNFRQHMDKVCIDLIPEDEVLGPQHIRNLFYGNYIEPDAEPKLYDEITDMEDLILKMEYYLNEYNLISKSPMNLVMFKFAIEHVSRVSRVLMQPNGNVLLVGIGGSGRHSSAKLAGSMAEYGFRTYGIPDWRDDLKKLLMRVGIEGKPLIFLFADTQIADEMFIEDINTVLNTADVPNLYAPDEKADILEKMQNAARDSGRKIEPTPLALYNFFIERVRSNLHVALCMSPIGDAFRVRCRMFPSLINCCTIDWFQDWPDDALERVAHMFLSQTGIGDEMTELCVSICKHFHVTVQEVSLRFFTEQRRKTYITPTSYLELIQTFKSLYELKVGQITMQRNRYETGLEKLDFAAGQVGIMQDELHDLQPKLIVASAKTEKLMIKIEQDTVVVEKQKEIVGADEALANEAAAAAQAIKDDCESDLSEAIPALEAAVDALNTLKPADITLVKSMKNPPSGVKLVMEAICVMKSIKPERKPDPGSGRMVEDFWGPSTKLLGDMKFLENLKLYDKDNIPIPVMKRIRERYIPDREFDPERIKSVSTACEGLCKWVRAMEVYDRVIKIVAPKKARLEEAETELATQMDTLNAKRAQLQEVADKLQALNDEFAAETKKKKELEDLINLCSQKLDRAEKLIGGLGGEKTRWSDAAKMLHGLLGNVIGDVVLSAGAIAYLGPFTVDYRQELLKNWNVYSIKMGIPCSNNFSLVITMGEPVVIRAWNIAGLPVDNYSTENGIIATTARRWPLMIDPQGQANKWVKNMEKHNRLQVIKLTDSNYLRVLENAITFGTPVVLENVNEEIDAVLDPVLVKNIFKQTGVWYIKLAENVLEYSFDFRFFITTRLRNPHYLPEIAVKVTLLNFMITLQGLQDQLLGIVVAREKPELEEKKNAMIVEGNILEDETAIKILSSSKVLSEEIQEKQKLAAITEKEIDSARNGYVPVSKHSSVLFFCISDLANIEPMYQYSLIWFINLYNQSITNSTKSPILEERLGYLNDHFTTSIYRNVCRSLFEKDKLIFSFVLTVGILRYQGKIDEDVWNFLLTGGVALDNPHANPAPEWLTDKSWSEIVRARWMVILIQLFTRFRLEKFRTSFQANPKAWKNFYDVPNPHEIPCPEPLHEIKGLTRLVAIRCVRPDKVVPAVQIYIVEEMGTPYLEPPQFNIQESYNDSNCCSPLVFILSAGSDPMAGLVRFAADKGISKTSLMTISLGQGQGPIASQMINTGLETGQWAVLQNCHLAESWMRELDRICDEVIIPENTHSNFRLWLTSYPSQAFPVAILQNDEMEQDEINDEGNEHQIKDEDDELEINDEEEFNAECFFCGKKRKQHRGKEQKMYSTTKGTVTDLIEKHSAGYSSYEGCVNYIKALPITPLPEVFGLHENADITKDNQETQILLHGVMLTQTQITSGGGGDDTQDMIIDLANDILGKVPDVFNVDAVSKKYPVMYSNSMNTVLRQELIRFNRLVVVVKRTLRDMIKAVKGLVVMSSELEQTCTALVVGKVPAAWASKSYPSLKPLGSYVTDLIARKKKMLDESFPKILFDVVPIMWLKPAAISDYQPASCYNCPVYKTSARRGVLSTTGHSTNFVMYTTFDSDLPEKHWINRGVASLCQLDD